MLHGMQLEWHATSVWIEVVEGLVETVCLEAFPQDFDIVSANARCTVWLRIDRWLPDSLEVASLLIVVDAGLDNHCKLVRLAEGARIDSCLLDLTKVEAGPPGGHVFWGGRKGLGG